MSAVGRTEARTPLWLAVVVVAAAVVLGLVVVGSVIRLQDRPLASGPAVAAPPAATPTESYALQVDGRKVAYQELSVTLPGAPFTCDAAPTAELPEFRSRVRCFAPVHPAYDAARHTWAAEVGVAIPSAPSTDVERAAGAVFDSILADSYRAAVHPRVVGRTSLRPEGVAPTGQAWAVYADVHVSAAGLPTTSDRLLVIAVRLAGGRTVVYYSDRPEDASAAVKAETLGALKSLSAFR